MLEIDGIGLTPFADRQIVFGSSAGETLDGQDDKDHLYGMAGDVTLNGSTGNDTILDSDGSGAIKLNGSSTALSGGDKKPNAEGLWESADKQTLYSKASQGDGKYTLTIFLASGETNFIDIWLTDRAANDNEWRVAA